MKVKFPVLLMVVALLAGAPITNAQQAPDPRIADLLRAGKVRVGVFPPQYIKGGKTPWSVSVRRQDNAVDLVVREDGSAAN